ncbi:MAG: HD domain-containing protein [Faecalibacterium sp.]|nr:HD domain-containing protein [Ruminococcus sp.]MCM1391765.1 HD domain-containing protein [Ruminococcus sp.]MCM1485045.1 HD domain-containing protein [Faecalibacterium sp.]
MYKIPKEAKLALDELNSKGFEAYLVGGFVRDMVMGVPSHDIDITTAARPNQIADVFSSYHVIETGLKHGTITVIINGYPIEITTYRTESGYSDNRHPDKVSFSNSLYDDLSRRDFTINALVYNPRDGIVDRFGGIDDINNRLIRCIGNAEDRFNEDSLRILRAIRFSSTLGFAIDTQTKKAIHSCKRLMPNLSKERVASELIKMLMGKDVKRVLMEYFDEIAFLIPQIAKMKNFNQHNFHHIYDVLEHTAVVTESIEPKPHLRLAALFHDCGKPDCFSLDEHGVGHFYSHASVSADKARMAMDNLKLDTFTKKRVEKLVRIHDSPIEADEITVKKKLNRLGEDLFRDLIALQRADNLGQATEFRFRQEKFDELERLIDKVKAENQCFSVKKLAVNGNDMISLGYSGRKIGCALNLLVDAVVEDKVENDKTKLIEYIKKHPVD